MTKELFTVYAIVSNIDGRIYVGFTKNLKRRIQEHNLGKNKSTKGFRPWTLFYTETLPDRLSARKKEKILKSGDGKQILKNYLHDYYKHHFKEKY
jgi:putative endonuclease